MASVYQWGHNSRILYDQTPCIYVYTEEEEENNILAVRLSLWLKIGSYCWQNKTKQNKELTAS